MPIRESEKRRYPENWPEISALKRFKARNRCQDCSLPNGAIGGRDSEGIWHDAVPWRASKGYRLAWPEPGTVAQCVGGWQLKIIKIVLTVGHKNHQPEDCSPRNLRCWCQQCHLRFDAKHKARGIKQRRRADRAVGDLTIRIETELMPKTAAFIRASMIALGAKE